MDKAFIKKILAVLLGICLVTTLFSLASLITDAALASDLQRFGSATEELTSMIKWSATGLVCVLAPAVAAAIYCFFGKNKIMPIIAAVAFLFLAASATGLAAAVRALGLKIGGSVNYATATAYMQELIQLAVPSFLICGYFIFVTASGFSAKKAAEPAENPAAEPAVINAAINEESTEGGENEEVYADFCRNNLRFGYVPAVCGLRKRRKLR